MLISAPSGRYYYPQVSDKDMNCQSIDQMSSHSQVVRLGFRPSPQVLSHKPLVEFCQRWKQVDSL